MKWLALVMLCLASAASARHARSPQYDCTERVERGDEKFEADRVHVYWITSLGGDGSVTDSMSLMLSAFPGANGLSDQGIYDPTANVRLAVGPPYTLDDKPRWAQLRIGGQALPPQPLPKLKEGRMAFFPIARLAPFLGRDGDLIIALMDKTGSVLRSESIPIRIVREAAAALPPLLARARWKSEKPAERCEQVISWSG